jgi:hypothetical protein
MIAELVEPDVKIGLRMTDIVAASNVDVTVDGPCDELVPEASALFVRA